MKPPDVIYLQWHGDAPTTYFDDDDNEVPIPEDEMDEGDPGDVTWCADHIYDADIPYRRADQVCIWVYREDIGVHQRLCDGVCGRYDERDTYCGNCGRRIQVEE